MGVRDERLDRTAFCPSLANLSSVPWASATAKQGGLDVQSEAAPFRQGIMAGYGESDGSVWRPANERARLSVETSTIDTVQPGSGMEIRWKRNGSSRTAGGDSDITAVLPRLAKTIPIGTVAAHGVRFRACSSRSQHDRMIRNADHASLASAGRTRVRPSTRRTEMRELPNSVPAQQ